MNKDEVMWKCPNCERLITSLIWTRNPSMLCPCNVVYYLGFTKFTLDKDDMVQPLIPIEEEIERVIKSMLKEARDEGYTTGFAAGQAVTMAHLQNNKEYNN